MTDCENESDTEEQDAEAQKDDHSHEGEARRISKSAAHPGSDRDTSGEKDSLGEIALDEKALGEDVLEEWGVDDLQESTASGNAIEKLVSNVNLISNGEPISDGAPLQINRHLWEGSSRGGQGEPGQGPEGKPKREGALSCGNEGEDPGPNPGSEASGGENDSSEAMWKSHFRGGLQEKVRVPKLVSDELTGALDDLKQSIDDPEQSIDDPVTLKTFEKYRPVLRHVCAHVYYCQTRLRYEYGNGVPLPHQVFEEACREHGVSVPSATATIWKVAEGELLSVQDYIYREDDVGRARKFLLTGGLLRRLRRAQADGYQYKTRYNLIDGKREYSSFKTQTTYDGDHSWKQRSELIFETLKELQGQRDLVNPEAVENHLGRLRERYKEAYQKYRDAERHLSRLKDKCLEEGKELANGEKKSLREARGEAYEAGREADRVRSRLCQDRDLWCDIIAQGLEKASGQPEGIYEYETAYEVQPSGRLTMLCGLQNASEEMKAAARTGIPEYNNLDIKSSQTEGLIQEMQMAVRMGADLDVSILLGYVESDGKDGLAEQFGIDRENWKRPEHAVKFGAGFNHATYSQARGAAEGKVLARIEGEDGNPDFTRLHQFDHESGKSAYERAVYNELPTMAAVARDWADDEKIEQGDPEEIYSMLREAYGEMADELDRWRDWLVSEYWPEACRKGSRFGQFVCNPCDIPFSIYDSRLAESGANPDRYNQKAGFATSRLQGLEAAYMHALARLQGDYGYEFLRNEHDGAVVIGTVPEEARKRARQMSGFHRAELETKPFEGHDKNTEEPCNTKTSSNPSTSSNTKTSSRPSAPERRERASRSAMSSGEAGPDDGSEDGKTDPDGAKTEKTPCGLLPPPPEPSSSTSGATFEATDASGSSTGPNQSGPSGKSSERTIGATSRESAPPDPARPEAASEPSDGETGEQFVPAGTEGTTSAEKSTPGISEEEKRSDDEKRYAGNAEKVERQRGDGAQELADHGKKTDADGNPLYAGETRGADERQGWSEGDLPELSEGPGDNYDPRYAGNSNYITSAVPKVGRTSSDARVFVGPGSRTFSTVEKDFYCRKNE